MSEHRLSLAINDKEGNLGRKLVPIRCTSTGPGVGGHCIPCDPYYLLWRLGKHNRGAPLIEQAMPSIDLRPERVIERSADVLAEAGRPLAGAKVFYLPGRRQGAPPGRRTGA